MDFCDGRGLFLIYSSVMEMSSKIVRFNLKCANPYPYFRLEKGSDGVNFNCNKSE